MYRYIYIGVFASTHFSYSRIHMHRYGAGAYLSAEQLGHDTKVLISSSASSSSSRPFPPRVPRPPRAPAPRLPPRFLVACSAEARAGWGPRYMQACKFQPLGQFPAAGIVCCEQEARPVAEGCNKGGANAKRL